MAQLAAIFGISFMVAMSGALAPGPLLSYTVMEAGRGRSGWTAGAKIIAGHAMLEAVILVVLLAGLRGLLTSRLARLAIGSLGSLSLLSFGVLGIVGAVRELRPAATGSGAAAAAGAITATGTAVAASAENPFAGRPILGGLVISLSNPYWWIWWASFGSAMIARWSLDFSKPALILAFWVGHEAGDLAWYLFVSIASSLGLSRLGGKTRSWIYGLLSLAICLFGGWIAWDTVGFARGIV